MLLFICVLIEWSCIPILIIYTQCFFKQIYVLQVVEVYGLGVGAQAHPCVSLVLSCILTLGIVQCGSSHCYAGTHYCLVKGSHRVQ